MRVRLLVFVGFVTFMGMLYIGARSIIESAKGTLAVRPNPPTDLRAE